ncbi:hypothetical protein N9L68_06820 [bacterium]|nr:hypothetical protein [bacterium]
MKCACGPASSACSAIARVRALEVVVKRQQVSCSKVACRCRSVAREATRCGRRQPLAAASPGDASV